MSPRVHHPGRSVQTTSGGFIPSISSFTHSASSAFAPPQFGTLSMFGRYYDDNSSGGGESNNSSSLADENDLNPREIFGDLNSSSNASATTLSELELNSTNQSSNTDQQVDEPDRESGHDGSDLSASRTYNSRTLSGRYVYSGSSGTEQEHHHQRVQQPIYIPPEADPNYHSRTSATTSPIGTRSAPVQVQPPPPPQQQQQQHWRNGHAPVTSNTTTEVVSSSPFIDPSSLPFASATRLAFGFLGPSEGRVARSSRSLGPPRRERETYHHGETDRDRTVPPQFRAKTVCKLDCRGCGSVVCMRGMKAMLLADTRVELFSTDCPPVSVQLVGEDYTTRNCRCKIRDVACIGCGGVCGYHITAPCGRCMEACNNGHFWMFHTEGVRSIDRLDGSGNKILLWASLPVVENDIDPADVYDKMCR